MVPDRSRYASKQSRSRGADQHTSRRKIGPDSCLRARLGQTKRSHRYVRQHPFHELASAAPDGGVTYPLDAVHQF